MLRGHLVNFLKHSGNFWGFCRVLNTIWKSYEPTLAIFYAMGQACFVLLSIYTNVNTCQDQYIPTSIHTITNTNNSYQQKCIPNHNQMWFSGIDPSDLFSVLLFYYVHIWAITFIVAKRQNDVNFGKQKYPTYFFFVPPWNIDFFDYSWFDRRRRMRTCLGHCVGRDEALQLSSSLSECGWMILTYQFGSLGDSFNVTVVWRVPILAKGLFTWQVYVVCDLMRSLKAWHWWSLSLTLAQWSLGFFTFMRLSVQSLIG